MMIITMIMKFVSIFVFAIIGHTLAISSSNISAQPPSDINMVDDNDTGCTLCYDGNIQDYTNLSFGGTSCQSIADILSQTPANSEICRMTQIQGYKYCHCPTYPNIYCSMCDTTTIQSNQSYIPIQQKYYNYIIPNTNGITCSEGEFILQSTNLCSIIQNASSFCGCYSTTTESSIVDTIPNTTTTSNNQSTITTNTTTTTTTNCNLCNLYHPYNVSTSSSSSTNATTTNTNKRMMIYPHRLLPPYFTMSCASYDRTLKYYYNDDDDNTNNCSSSTTIIASNNMDISTVEQQQFLSIFDYCGCPTTTTSNDVNISKPFVCTKSNMCDTLNQQEQQSDNNNDTIEQPYVYNPNTIIYINYNNSSQNSRIQMTCYDIQMIANYITDDTYCTTFYTEYESICCTKQGNHNNDGDETNTTITDLPPSTTTTTSTTTPKPNLVPPILDESSPISTPTSMMTSSSSSLSTIDRFDHSIYLGLFILFL